jgi:hypothetical protein
MAIIAGRIDSTVGLSSGQTSLMALSNSSGVKVHQCLYFDGGDNTDEFLHVIRGSGMVAARSTPATTIAADARIACTLAGVTMYIPAFTAVTIT